MRSFNFFCLIVLASAAGAMFLGAATPGPREVPGGSPAPRGRGVGRTAADLTSMEAALLAPDAAVTLEQLRAVVALDMEINPPTEPQVMGFSSMIVMDMMPAYQTAYTKYGGELARSLMGKTEAARGSCVQTLLHGYVKLSAEDQDKVRPWVPGVLEKMSKDEVTGVLNNRWVMVRSPALLPVLLKMYDGLPDEQVTAGRYGASEERNALLRRAYELNPEQVRGRVLAAIQNPGQRFYEMWVSSLLGLPDKELPEMDDAFIAMLSVPRGGVPLDVSAKLIARYGTAKVEETMKKVYEQGEGRWACTIQASMLAYFLRVDVEYGSQAFARSLASRRTGCWKMLIQQEAAIIWTPGLEKECIANLDHGDTMIAVSAARALRAKGSAAAKVALLEAVKRAYRANPSEDWKEPGSAEAARQRALIEALVEGHAWVLTAQELADLQEQATLDDLKSLCQKRAQEKSVAIELRLGLDGLPSIQLDGERYATVAELERKVSLYPAGTKFAVKGDTKDPVLEEFSTWAKEKQLAVELGK